MLKTVLKGNVILEDKILSGGAVVIEGEKISGVFPQEHKFPDKEINYFDYVDKFISPGLIDLHLHGALGKDVMDADVESLNQIAFHQAECGVTGFLAGTTSSSLDSILKAVEAVKKAAELPQPSEILGVYIEGPFLNQERKGAQDPDFIRGISQEDIDVLIEATRGLSTVICIAPEVNNNMSFIKTLREKGIIVAIGHSDATYQQALDSFKQGITHATHLFNAMSGYHHREPGVAGAVFDSPEVTAEVIADGINLHPSAVRLAVARKGEDKICLITDSLKAAGLGDGIYQMGNLEFEVKGAEARLKESGVLVGSVMTLNKAVKNVIGWTRIKKNQGVNMASLNPARVLGLDDEIGSIQKGKYANLAIFDTEFNVVETIRRGQFVLKK